MQFAIPHFAFLCCPASFSSIVAHAMLLERDEILDELDQLSTAAAGGRGRISFIVGEAGIGKTSVLRAVAARVGERLRPLWAACEDWSTAEALTLLRDLSVLERSALDQARDSGSRLDLFHRALARLTDVPTVLFVEDLHWADDGSIDFIRYLGRRIADKPLLIVASSRNEDQDARARLIRAANDIPPATRHRCDLRRLSAPAVGALAAASGLIGSAIHAATGGNPLYVTEMLASGGTRSRSIDDLVVGRADQLPAGARALLDYCSIIPRRVAFEQIEYAGADERALQACLDSGLLLAELDSLVFRHEVMRRAVEDALSPLRRRQLHTAELDRLEQAGASATRRLHHALGANDIGRVRDAAPQAAMQASALGAHREAVRAWGSILDKENLANDPEQCTHYAFELHVTGDVGAAVVWQGRALAIYERIDDRKRLGDGLRFLSRLHYLNGHRTLSEQAGHRAVALLEKFPATAELALAYANLAHLAMLAEDAEEAVRWSEEAIPIAEALARDDILATVFNNYGTAIQYRDPQRAFDLLERSIALGLATGAQEHVARAYTNKCWMLMSGRRHEEALAAQLQGVAFCIEHDLETWRDYIAGGHALSLMELGRWNDAEQQAAMVLTAEQDSHLIRNPAARAMAQLHIRRGSPDADALIEELSRHMDNGREGPRFTSLALIVAEQCWTKGTATEPALTLLGEAASLAKENGSPWDRAALWHWSRALGQHGPSPPDMPEPYALSAAGDVAAAANAFEALGMPFEQALMLAKGNVSQVARSLAILDRVGAPATAARIRVELKGTGGGIGSRGPRASTLGNRFGLTKREIDVLGALDKGWTNREIGERLFVSAKTVDHHVSAILGKLDARTRGEAVAFARAEGLLKLNIDIVADDRQS